MKSQNREGHLRVKHPSLFNIGLFYLVLTPHGDEVPHGRVRAALGQPAQEIATLGPAEAVIATLWLDFKDYLIGKLLFLLVRDFAPPAEPARSWCSHRQSLTELRRGEKVASETCASSSITLINISPARPWAWKCLPSCPLPKSLSAKSVKWYHNKYFFICWSFTCTDHIKVPGSVLFTMISFLWLRKGKSFQLISKCFKKIICRFFLTSWSRCRSNPWVRASGRLGCLRFEAHLVAVGLTLLDHIS